MIETLIHHQQNSFSGKENLIYTLKYLIELGINSEIDVKFETSS